MSFLPHPFLGAARQAVFPINYRIIMKILRRNYEKIMKANINPVGRYEISQINNGG
jgi:hypothetical protein